MKQNLHFSRKNIRHIAFDIQSTCIGGTKTVILEHCLKVMPCMMYEDVLRPISVIN